MLQLVDGEQCAAAHGRQNVCGMLMMVNKLARAMYMHTSYRVCIAALHAMGALPLSCVGADAAAVAVALRIAPACTLVVVRVWAGTPCVCIMDSEGSERREGPLHS